MSSLATAFAALTLAAAAQGDPFAMRVGAAALDDACGGLSSGERAALESGLAQARREHLRRGVGGSDLVGWEARLRDDAATIPCGSEQAEAVFATIRSAYRAWLAQPGADYPGPRRSWTVDRLAGEDRPWSVRQETQDARFGLALTGNEATALLAGRSDTPPASAALVIRDTARAPRPVDATAGGLLPPPGGEPLAAWGPPSGREARWWANGSHPGSASAYAPEGEGRPYAFAFPAAALEALAELEPRESARIDLHARDGARIGSVWMEAGLLRAALDFASAGEPAAAR
jgi:hypothetical protein